MSKDCHTVWCWSCKLGLVLAKPFPPACPLCGGVPSWTHDSPTPRVPYSLTDTDRRFLRSFRIQPD